MSLMQLGRARLAIALPRHRRALCSAKDDLMLDLFESYALASTTLDTVMREVPSRPELVSEYQQICVELQSEVIKTLSFLESRARGSL